MGIWVRLNRELGMKRFFLAMICFWLRRIAALRCLRVSVVCLRWDIRALKL